MHTVIPGLGEFTFFSNPLFSIIGLLLLFVFALKATIWLENQPKPSRMPHQIFRGFTWHLVHLSWACVVVGVLFGLVSSVSSGTQEAAIWIQSASLPTITRSVLPLCGEASPVNWITSALRSVTRLILGEISPVMGFWGTVGLGLGVMLTALGASLRGAKSRNSWLSTSGDS